MSNQRVFVDSNVWLYHLLADLDPNPQEDTRKRNIALNLTNAEGIIVSTQVINEVCSILLKRVSLSESQIFDLIGDFESRCTIVELTVTTLQNASQLRTRYNFSFWDSLIVASALAAEARILYSEDMQDGLVILEQIEIINPFRVR